MLSYLSVMLLAFAVSQTVLVQDLATDCGRFRSRQARFSLSRFAPGDYAHLHAARLGACTYIA